MAAPAGAAVGWAMRSLHRSLHRSLAGPVALAIAALALPAVSAPAAAATTLDTETYRVQPSNKLLRFQLLLKDEGVVVLTFAVKRKGTFKVLDKEVVGATFVDGSTDAIATVPIASWPAFGVPSLWRPAMNSAG